MPPKRAANKNVSPEELLAARKEQLENLKQQCAAVEKMLSISTDQRVRLDAEIASLERRIAEAEMAAEHESRDLDDKVKFMDTFSSTNLDQLQQRHASMVKAAHEAEAENEALRSRTEDLKQRKTAELADWDAKLAEQQSLMNSKALDFGLQLKDALAKNYKAS